MAHEPLLVEFHRVAGPARPALPQADRRRVLQRRTGAADAPTAPGRRGSSRRSSSRWRCRRPRRAAWGLRPCHLCLWLRPDCDRSRSRSLRRFAGLGRVGRVKTQCSPDSDRRWFEEGLSGAHGAADWLMAVASAPSCRRCRVSELGPVCHRWRFRRCARSARNVYVVDQASGESGTSAQHCVDEASKRRGGKAGMARSSSLVKIDLQGMSEPSTHMLKSVGSPRAA